MSKVSVVILNYNGKGFLQQFLPNVIRCSPGARVIVADNCSTDDSVAWLSQAHPNLDLITFEKNRGYAGGYNHALKHLNEEYFILLNSDVEVTERWIEPMLELMESDKSITACQPKILDYNNRNQFEYAGAAGGFIDKLGYPFCRGRVFSTIEIDAGQYNQAIPVFWASGACLMVRGSVFKEIGGFDEEFFAHMEEIDLCWRMQAKGLKVYCEPGSVIYHVGGGTLNQGNPFKTFLNFRNGLHMLTKNTYSGLIWKIPLRIFLDLLAAVMFLFQGRGKSTLAVLRAHWHFLLNLGTTLGKRKSLKFAKAKGALIYKGLLPWAYYMGAKRKYSELMD